jgi:hypothetical protein
MCLSQDPESRSALKPVATRDPRKDPAVHVSLPSDAIVKQQRDSPQRTSFRTFSGPGTPSKSRSDAARTRTKPQFPQAPIPIETKTGEKPTSSPPSPLRKERQRSLFARNQTRHQIPPLGVAVDVLVGERRYRERPLACQTLFEVFLAALSRACGQSSPTHCEASALRAAVAPRRSRARDRNGSAGRNGRAR